MKSTKIFDKERVSFNLAKLKKGGENFEVVINPDAISAYRSGRAMDAKEVLMYEKVFYDVKKGLEASHEHMKSLFGSDEPLEVAKTILQQGEIQFTQEYREQKRKKKWNRIVDINIRNAIDPRSGLPHPRMRIESAIEEAKVRIDDLKEPEDQVNDIVSKLKPILPIKLALKEIQVKIPSVYAGKAYSIVERLGKILADSWQTDGSWLCSVDIPAGLQNDFFDALNKLTHGNMESSIIREK